jgi:hypothetical protein
VARRNLNPAECQPEPIIAFELARFLLTRLKVRTNSPPVVPGMANLKIHRATPNAISPKPAMMNPDHLLEHSAYNIIRTLMSFVLLLASREFVIIDHEMRGCLSHRRTCLANEQSAPVKIKVTQAIQVETIFISRLRRAEISRVASTALMGSRTARTRSIALGNFEPAECHPESTIAFERVPLFADENEGKDKLAIGGREIDPNLLPFVGTLLDPSSFEIPGRFEHAMRCWIKGDNGVVCGPATRR